jgi:hypothetical protein
MIAVVIVSQQVQHSVQRQNANFRALVVRRLSSLPPGHTSRDHNITEESRPVASSYVASGFGRTAGRNFLRPLNRPISWKRQHIRRVVAPPVPAIERTGDRISDQRDADVTAGAAGRHPAQPRREAVRPHGPAPAVGDGK